MTSLSTLCYIEKDGQYLMLHRTVKKNDVNKDKWIGVGGHFEADESPEECVLREVKEETGYTLTSYRFRGIVTFVSGNGVTEYMHLFTADEFEGKSIACDEGELEWVKKEDVLKLNIWEGDRIGTFRANVKAKYVFGGTVFTKEGAFQMGSEIPYEALLQRIIGFFDTGVVPVTPQETIEIFTFMEAASVSKARGGVPVMMSEVYEKASREAQEILKKY